MSGRPVSAPGGRLAPPSPIPVTSRPVRARLDAVKAEMNTDMRKRLGRDATWNEVAERLLDAYDFVGHGWPASPGRE